MRLPVLLGAMAASIAALGLTSGVAPAAAATAPGCGHTATMATVAPAPQTRATVRCLLNGIRRRHGLRRLSASGPLNVAAARHSADMVARGFFAHVTPEGLSVVDRVRASGYLAGSQDWSVGEDIGWGTGTLSTPGAIVDEWMHSPPHRAVILDRTFTHIGIGIARGVPVPGGDGDGATFVLDLGDVAR